MDELDKNRLLDFYGSRKKIHGLGAYQTLSWSQRETQLIRFKVLSEISPKLENSTILDLGSGFGELLDYFEKKFTIKNYLGIDIEKDFVGYANQTRGTKTTKFIVGDFFGMALPKKDFVFISGALNFKIKDSKEEYLKLIARAFNACNVALGFNMLDSKFHIDNEEFQTYSPEEVMEYCLGLTDNVKLVRGYLDYDFTIYMYK